MLKLKYVNKLKYLTINREKKINQNKNSEVIMENRFYVNYAVSQVVNLCKIPSPSGFTKKAEKYLLEELSALGFSPYQTNKGSVVAEIGGEGNPLILAAHIDTLGAMVRAVKSNGRLRFTKVGGFPENYIESENCIVHTRKGKEYSGTFMLTNPSVHVNRKVGSTTRDDSNIELVLDVKVENKKDVEKLGIRTGDFISFDARTMVTKEGFIKSRHLDDKESAGILLALAKYVKDENIELNRKVYLLFTNYEEVGHGGASGIPEDAKEIISVDMGAVGDDLATTEHKVSICAKDSGGPYDYDVTSKLIELAEANKLDFAIDIYPYYGSDAGATLSAGYDLKHGLIGPGVYASHGYERSHKDGVKNTFELLRAYIQK